MDRFPGDSIANVDWSLRQRAIRHEAGSQNLPKYIELRTSSFHKVEIALQISPPESAAFHLKLVDSTNPPVDRNF